MKLLIILFFLFSYSFLFSQDTDSSLVFIKGGIFTMGSNNKAAEDEKKHKVWISDFYISKYEVTNLEFVEFLNQNGNQVENNAFWILLNGEWRDERCRIYLKDSVYKVEKGYEYFPVLYVSWYGAAAYCKWRNGRLPTEAEWEYVAKGGKYKKDNSLIDFENNIVFAQNSDLKPNRIATKLPNILGVYDIYGNQAEWCSDWYWANYYNGSKFKNPKGKPNGQMKIYRGGSWYSQKNYISATDRKADNPANNNITIGFRIVKNK